MSHGIQCSISLKGHTIYTMQVNLMKFRQLSDNSYGKVKFSLTAFLDGFITPVRTVSNLVAHFTHLNALSAATLELLWPTALSHCFTHKGHNFHSILGQLQSKCIFFSPRRNRMNHTEIIQQRWAN